MNPLLFILRKNLAIMDIIDPEQFSQEENVDNICWICNKEIKTTNCDTCNVDFNDIFKCPLLNDEALEQDKNICNITKSECKIKGIEYESCDNYHSVNI